MYVRMFVYIIQLEIIDSDRHIILNYLLTNQIILFGLSMYIWMHSCTRFLSVVNLNLDKSILLCVKMSSSSAFNNYV